MNHSVAVGTDQGQIVQTGFPSFPKSRHWYGVMALDEILTTLTVGLEKIESANFTTETAKFLKD